MKTIYVGCSLTHAPEEFKASVEGFKTALRNEGGYEVLEFIGLVGGTAEDVYRWDVEKCVGTCSLFIAICDYPSIGLGYELATAVEKRGVQTLAVAHRDAKVTRLVLGITHPRFQFRRYDELSELVPLVKELFAKCE